MRGPGPARAARARRLLIARGFLGQVGADRRRKHVERKTVAAAVSSRPGLAPFILVIRAALFTSEAARFTLSAWTTLTAILAFTSFRPLFALLGLKHFAVAGLDEIIIALIFVIIITMATRILLLEARSAFAEDTEIMIRELKIIFGLDAVACELGVARHALVFLKELRGIAALAIVLAVSRLSAEILTPLPPTTAPAAALTIVDQASILSSSR